MFACDGIIGHQRDRIALLLRICAAADTKPGELIDDDAITLLATRPRTPPQIE